MILFSAKQVTVIMIVSTPVQRFWWSHSTLYTLRPLSWPGWEVEWFITTAPAGWDTRESPLRIMVGQRWPALFIAAKPLHYIKLPISRDVWTHRPFHLSYSALATALQYTPPHATPSALALLGYISQCLDICWGSAQWVGLSSWALGNREIAQTVSGTVIKTSSRSLH